MLPNLHITTYLTWRCLNKCWYCSSLRSCAAGQHIDVCALLKFYDILRENSRAGNIGRIAEIEFTGGGDPLQLKQVRQPVEAAAGMAARVAMTTSGACTRSMGRRLEDISPLITDLRISHDAENQESYHWLHRTFQCARSRSSRLVSRIDPRHPHSFAEDVALRVGEALVDEGYSFVDAVPSLLDAMLDNLRQEHNMYLGHFVRDECKMTVLRGVVDPRGRALSRLRHIRMQVPERVVCRSMDMRGAINLHILPEGYLTYCCHDLAKPVQPMTYDGLMAMIEGFAAARERVHRAYVMARGEYVHHACDVCPLNR